MKQEARIVLALKMALVKPQLLEYIRHQIIQDFLTNLETITDKQIEEYLEITKARKA